MKFALKVVAFVSLAATQAFAAITTIDDIYSLICDSNIQYQCASGTDCYDETNSVSYDTTALYTDASPFQWITGFALGQQKEANVTDSTCFGQSYQTKEFLESISEMAFTIGYQLYNFDFTDLTTNGGTLMVDVNNLMIQMTDQMTACQTELKIKQFATRTQEFSGFFNWVFTIGYGTFYNVLEHTYLNGIIPAIAQQEMNIAMWNIVNPIVTLYYGKTINCRDFGYNMGLWLSDSLTAKVDTTVALIEVQAFQ